MLTLLRHFRKKAGPAGCPAPSGSAGAGGVVDGRWAVPSGCGLLAVAGDGVDAAVNKTVVRV